MAAYRTTTADKSGLINTNTPEKVTIVRLLLNARGGERGGRERPGVVGDALVRIGKFTRGRHAVIGAIGEI
jgi:hypothetical protein